MDIYLKILLISLFILATPFAISFIWGYYSASRSGSDKQRRLRAIYNISQMDEHQRKALIDIYQAYRKNNIVRANDITNNLPSHITDFLISNFDYRNRPKEFSSGALGANTWIAFSNELKSMGYSDTVSLIIPLVVLDNYNEVLDKIIDKENDK